MISRPAGSGFSITRTLGRKTSVSRGMQFGQPHQPRLVVAGLAPADHAAIKARLTPVLTGLETARAAHVHQTERKLRLAMAGAGLAGLVLGWSMFGGLLGALALMAAAALFVLLVLFQDAQNGPRRASKAEIVAGLAGHLSGLAVDRDPVVPAESLARLRLLPPVRKVTVDLRLTGRQSGRAVAVSRIGLFFGQEQNFTEKQGGGVAFVMVEVAVPETAQAQSVTAIIATDAARMLRVAPKLTHGLTEAPTGDAGFDTRYTVYGNPAPVTPALRAAFAAIEAETRCASHGLTEVAPGSGLRPWVALLPGQLVVLTPLTLFDGAFEPPPYWEPLDVDALIPAFASDLTILNGYLTAALSLPVGDPA